jgi:hypothetical protein
MGITNCQWNLVVEAMIDVYERGEWAQEEFDYSTDFPISMF